MMQKVADGINEVKAVLAEDEGWRIVDKWIERRHESQGQGDGRPPLFLPEDCTVFLLEKE